MGDPRMLNSFAATAAGGLMLRKDILPELTEYVAFSESYYDMFRTQDKDEDGLVPYGVWATLCRYMAANTGSATLLFEVARMLIERPKLTDMLIANDQDGDFPTWDPFAILNNASILALATASGRSSPIPRTSSALPSSSPQRISGTPPSTALSSSTGFPGSP